MILTGFSLALTGFIALSLAMKRHLLQVQPQRLRETPSKRLVSILRSTGYLCLFLSAVFCIASEGVAVGLVFWAGLTTTAALLQSLLLTYRPLWVIPTGLAALVMAVLIGLSSSGIAS